MSTVLVYKSISLDGYVAGPDVSEDDPMGKGGERLHDWQFADPIEPRDAELVAGFKARSRATVVGRRTFDLGLPHWQDVPWPGESFVVTHRARPQLPQRSGTFTFTGGVEDAVASARAAAGDGVVILMGAQVCRQALAAGLVDEVLLSLVPVTLGGGARLFDEAGPLTLRPRATVASPAVTHLHYDVVR